MIFQEGVPGTHSCQKQLPLRTASSSHRGLPTSPVLSAALVSPYAPHLPRTPEITNIYMTSGVDMPLDSQDWGVLGADQDVIHLGGEVPNCRNVVLSQCCDVEMLKYQMEERVLYQGWMRLGQQSLGCLPHRHLQCTPKPSSPPPPPPPAPPPCAGGAQGRFSRAAESSEASAQAAFQESLEAGI